MIPKNFVKVFAKEKFSQIKEIYKTVFFFFLGNEGLFYPEQNYSTREGSLKNIEFPLPKN